MPAQWIPAFAGMTDRVSVDLPQALRARGPRCACAPAGAPASHDLLRQLVVDAFDVPVQAEKGAVVDLLAFLGSERPVLLVDRAGEDEELARLDLVDGGLCLRLDVVRHVPHRSEDDVIVGEARPGLARLP